MKEVETLAILSGKGGSGKTTIALSFAQMFAASGKRVLLIDCDLCTYGATFFFQDELEKKETHLSFLDILIGSFDEDQLNESDVSSIIFCDKDTNINFIPSYLKFNAPEMKKGVNNYNVLNLLKFILQYQREPDYREVGTLIQEKTKIIDRMFSKLIKKGNYDIAIFDCQSGYSLETEVINRAELINKRLYVFETDIISKSAANAMNKQLNYIEKETHQVYNKTTSPEQKIYSDPNKSHLTYNNLKAIEFSWAVKAAYSQKKLPSIDVSNPLFSNTICDLAKSLFPLSYSTIRDFVIEIKKGALNDLNKNLYELTKKMKARSQWIKFLGFTNGAIVLVMCAILFWGNINIDTIMATTVAIVILFTIIGWSMKPLKPLKKDLRERDKLANEYETLLNEIDVLHNTIKDESNSPSETTDV